MTNTVKKKHKIVRLRRSERLRVQIPIVIVLCFAIFFTLIPFLLTIINSLKSNVEVQKSIFTFPALDSIMWGNYKIAFGYIGANIWNSVVIAFVQSAVLVILSAIMAYIFAEVKFFGSNLIFYIYIIYPILTIVKYFLSKNIFFPFKERIDLLKGYLYPYCYFFM